MDTPLLRESYTVRHRLWPWRSWAAQTTVSYRSVLFHSPHPHRPKPMSLRNRMGGKPYSHAWPLDTAPLHSGALWKCPGWSLSCQIIHLRPEFQKNGQTSILIMSYPDVPFLHALPPVGAIFQPKMCGFETILKHTPIRHLFSLILGKGARRRYVRRVRSLKPEAPGVQISK